MNMKIQCDVCGQSVWQDYSSRLMKCAICGLVRAKMNPSAAELEQAYKENYFFGEEYFDYFQDRPALEKNFRNRLKRLEAYLSPSSILLEIGCSYGFFLNLCKEKAKKVVGYDITKEGIEYAKKELGLDVYCDSFMNYEGEKADMVCLWDVVEHLPNPDQIIGKISVSIKTGGHIALTTGDIGAVAARIRKDKWRMVHPPTHLFYFDKKTITKLLAKHGFRIVYFGHTTIYRNVDSVFNQLAGKQNPQSISSKILKFLHGVVKKLGLHKVNFGLNLFDIMEVIAEKK